MSSGFKMLNKLWVVLVGVRMERVHTTIQFGTQVKFRWSRDHNNRTAENAFSAPWYYSEMELEPVAG